MSQFEYINSINKVIAKVDSEEVASAIKEAAALCAEAIGSLYIAKKDQRGPTESSFAQREHRK